MSEQKPHSWSSEACPCCWLCAHWTVDAIMHIMHPHRNKTASKAESVPAPPSPNEKHTGWFKMCVSALGLNKRALFQRDPKNMFLIYRDERVFHIQEETLKCPSILLHVVKHSGSDSGKHFSTYPSANAWTGKLGDLDHPGKVDFAGKLQTTGSVSQTVCIFLYLGLIFTKKAKRLKNQQIKEIP